MARKQPTFRPEVEYLEGRCLPSSVVADFAGQGLFRYTEGSGWALLSTADPEQVVVAANGDVFGDFGSAGLWRFDNRFGYWGQLSTMNPELIAAAGNSAI